MTRNMFRTISVCAAITLCCASGMAAGRPRPSPLELSTTGIIDAEKAKAKSLRAVQSFSR